MKINITFNLDETARLAIANHHGKDKPADYNTCKWNIRLLVETHIEDLVSDMDRNEERKIWNALAEGAK